jgi:hypothetical protein
MRRSLLLAISFVLMLVLTVPIPAALASDDWCDTDPILLVHTPAGYLVPVFVNVGAPSVLFSPNTLLGSVVMSYKAAPAGDGRSTKVTVSVTVPPSLLAQLFATRDTVSTGAFGTGWVYANGTGVSGSAMLSTFQLPYP